MNNVPCPIGCTHMGQLYSSSIASNRARVPSFLYSIARILPFFSACGGGDCVLRLLRECVGGMCFEVSATLILAEYQASLEIVKRDTLKD